MTRAPQTRIRRSAVLSGALLLALGFGTASAARADLPSPLRLHREVRSHVRDVLRHLDRIPDRIERHHRAHLQVFLGGSSYYAPHRHHHVTYHFPIVVGGVVSYRPYVYCDDRLFHGPRERPRLWVEWSVVDHGAWCGHHRGYYPHQHSCFRPARRDARHDRSYDRGRDRRHDDRRFDHRRHDDHRFDAKHRCTDRCDRDDRFHRSRGRDRDDDRRDRRRGRDR